MRGGHRSYDFGARLLQRRSCSGPRSDGRCTRNSRGGEARSCERRRIGGVLHGWRNWLGVLQRRDNGWFWNPIYVRDNLISGTTDSWSKRLQLFKELSFKHDRRTNMFDKSSGDVIVNQSIMSFQCPVQILRNSISPPRQDLFILVCLEGLLDVYNIVHVFEHPPLPSLQALRRLFQALCLSWLSASRCFVVWKSRS